MGQNVEKYGRGHLLIANPSLQDPNFKRSVVLLCEHNNEGSYGLILNRPTTTRLSELLPDHPLLKNEKSTINVGGPCQVERVQMLHGFRNALSDSIEICKDVFMGKNFNKILEIINLNLDKNPDYRFFMGYSGWGAGQLEEEMESNSWITAPANYEIVFKMDKEKMWADVLKNLGNYYSFLATIPPDIRVN